MRFRKTYIDDLDRQLLRQAYVEAVSYSTDPSTQNGAVLVGEDRKVLCNGSNHFPVNVKETPERWERPIKYSFVEHAERNCIYSAARNGIATQGLVMYCPWFACADCARAIIQAGIRTVIGHNTLIHNEGSEAWKQSVAIGDAMFEEAGVETLYVSGEMGFNILFNGKKVAV